MAGLKVVVFFGSVREGRLGYRLATYLKKVLEEKNFSVNLFDPEEMKFPLMAKNVNMYVGSGGLHTAPKWLQDAYHKVNDADAYMVVSAEYNHSIPPALSNMMDYFPIPSFSHKPCSIVTYSYGPFGGVRASVQLRTFVGELGMVTPQFIFAVPFVQEALSEDGKPLKDDIPSKAEKAVKELEWFARALKTHKENVGPL
ncbi:hypothetical protein CHUAL_004467 [Chamberlinius hualienensis]